MKIGLQLPGFASGEEGYYEHGEQERYSISDMVRHSVKAEKLGFDFICKATGMAMREPFVPYTLIAQATKRVRLMTSIIDVYTRSPIVAAKTMGNLDEVSKGRCVLGIGKGALPLSKQEGIPLEKTVQRIREWIKIVKHLFSEESLDFDGEIFKLRGAKLGFTPHRKFMPVYIGGAGPKVMRLAGELADGVFLGTASYSEYVKDALKNIQSGAENAGRNYNKIEVVGSSLLCVGSKKQTDRYVKPLMAFFGSIGQVDYNMKFTPFYNKIIEIGRLYKTGKIAQAADSVTDEMIDALTVTGTVQECQERLARFSRLGISTYRVLPVGYSISEAYDNAFKVCQGIL